MLNTLREGVKTSLRPIKRSLQSAVRPLTGGPIRVANPFASHIPVLMGMARLCTVRRVFELGSGTYSTLTFLNRTAFPDLEHLLSYENDPEWKEKVQAMVGDDPRLELRLATGSMREIAEDVDSAGFDLIFIDDSVTTEERVATIRTIASKLKGFQVAIVHDYECTDYQQAAQKAACHFHFDAILPNTGLAASALPFNAARLQRLHSLILGHGDRIEPDDIQRWARVFESKL